MGPVGEVNLEELSSCTALSLFGKEVSSQAVQPRVLLMLSILVRSIFSFPLCRNQWVFHVFYQNTLTQSQACDFGFVFLAASRAGFSNGNFGYTRSCCGVFPFQEMLCASAGNASGLTRQCLSPSSGPLWPKLWWAVLRNQATPDLGTGGGHTP